MFIFSLGRWTSAHNLLVDAGLKRADLKEMIAKSGMVLREGSTKLFKQLNDAGVPCLVFSAGIGDVLAEAITQFSKFFPNMQIVSNFMDFDEQVSKIKLGRTGRNLEHVLVFQHHCTMLPIILNIIICLGLLLFKIYVW